MEFVDTIHLNTLQIALVVALSVATIWLESLGMGSKYLCGDAFMGALNSNWASGTYLVFPGSNGVICLGSVSKHRKFLELPKNDRWIVLWMFIWWMWMLLLIGLFSPDNKEIILLREEISFAVRNNTSAIFFAYCF